MTKISEAVAKYMELRQIKDSIDEEYKEKLGKVRKAMDMLESHFLKYFDSTGQTQIKTSDATVFVKTNDYAQVADWDAVLEFVRENDAYEFLEKRVSKTAVRDYIDDKKEVPPGINYGSKLSVNVRKA
jgi:hypothetical protein